MRAVSKVALAAPLLGLVIVLVPASRAEDATPIRGRVVDQEGKPVPGVEVGTGWRFRDGALPAAQWRSGARTYAKEGLRTDREGRFAGPVYFSGRPVALVALDPAGKRGGIGILDEKNVDGECTIMLRPLVGLRGRIGIEDKSLEAGPVYVYVFDPRAPIAFASCIAQDRFSFRLPAGSYQLLMTAKDLVPRKTPLKLEAGGGDVDLGLMDLSPTNLAQHYGREPPAWTVTAARGVGKDVRLSDYKGKWVLIEFWAYW